MIENKCIPVFNDEENVDLFNKLVNTNDHLVERVGVSVFSSADFYMDLPVKND